MYHVITDSGVTTGRNLKLLNKKLDTQLEDSEFKIIGSDKVCKLSNDDLTFLQDKRRLSLIPISNLYKVDNSVKYVVYFILFLQFILLVKK